MGKWLEKTYKQYRRFAKLAEERKEHLEVLSVEGGWQACLGNAIGPVKDCIFDAVDEFLKQEWVSCGDCDACIQGHDYECAIEHSSSSR